LRRLPSEGVTYKADSAPTQQTQPKKGEPIDIPIPKEDDFEKLVRRAVPHRPAPDVDSDSTGGAED
jgi:hypothetical protein